MQFSEAKVISLRRTPDRLEQFRARPWPADWQIDWMPAVPGNVLRGPDWWNGGWGAFGCWLSHTTIWQDAIDRNLDSVVIFEDDAFPVPNFSELLDQALSELPKDWHMLYLGGQHHRMAEGRPTPYSKTLVKAFNVNRTHAYAISRAGILAMWPKLWSTVRHGNPPLHIDHKMGVFHKDLNTYAITPWICGQAPGKSTVAGTNFESARLYHDERVSTQQSSVYLIFGTGPISAYLSERLATVTGAERPKSMDRIGERLMPELKLGMSQARAGETVWGAVKAHLHKNIVIILDEPSLVIGWPKVKENLPSATLVYVEPEAKSSDRMTRLHDFIDLNNALVIRDEREARKLIRELSNG